jgi:hypothetical protein
MEKITTNGCFTGLPDAIVGGHEAAQANDLNSDEGFTLSSVGLTSGDVAGEVQLIANMPDGLIFVAADVSPLIPRIRAYSRRLLQFADAPNARGFNLSSIK